MNYNFQIGDVFLKPTRPNDPWQLSPVFVFITQIKIMSSIQFGKQHYCLFWSGGAYGNVQNVFSHRDLEQIFFDNDWFYIPITNSQKTIK